MSKTIFQVKGEATYAGPGLICLDESLNVLADNAEQAIKKARQYFLKQEWEDTPDSGKNKGKTIHRRCKRFVLEGIEKIATANI